MIQIQREKLHSQSLRWQARSDNDRRRFRKVYTNKQVFWLKQVFIEQTRLMERFGFRWGDLDGLISLYMKKELVHSQLFVWLTQWLTSHIFTAIMRGRQPMIVVKSDTCASEWKNLCPSMHDVGCWCMSFVISVPEGFILLPLCPFRNQTKNCL